MRDCLREGKEPWVPTKLSDIKGHIPGWLLHAWRGCADRPEMLQKGWAKCGLLDAWNIQYQREAVANYNKIFGHDGLDHVPEEEEAAEVDDGYDSADDDLTLVELCRRLVIDDGLVSVDAMEVDAPHGGEQEEDLEDLEL